MRQRGIILTVLALAFAGCQTPAKTQVWMEELEQEIRDKEDAIFDLEAENERLCKELERCQHKLEMSGSAPARSYSPPTERPSVMTPRREEKSREAPPHDDLVPPTVEGLGVPDVAPPRTAPRSSPAPAAPTELPPLPGGAALPHSSAPDELPAPADGPTRKSTPTTEELDPNVNHIQVNPTQTTGYDVDGAAGDDGIRILLEPRNAAEQFVPVAAPVSIVVLDPAEEGEAQRLARWDFTAAQADGALQAALPETGMLFQLPWVAAPPKHNKLKVCVRYASPSGEKLEAYHDVYVDLPGQISHRWTPATGPKRAYAQDTPPGGAVPASHTAPLSPAADTVSPPDSFPAPATPLPTADRRPRWRPFR